MTDYPTCKKELQALATAINNYVRMQLKDTAYMECLRCGRISIEASTCLKCERDSLVNEDPNQ